MIWKLEFLHPMNCDWFRQVNSLVSLIFILQNCAVIFEIIIRKKKTFKNCSVFSKRTDELSGLQLSGTWMKGCPGISDALVESHLKKHEHRKLEVFIQFV